MGVGKALGIAALLAFAPGCFWFTTKSEGKQLRADLDGMEGRMSKTEQALEDKLVKLDAAIDKATKLLARNSADLGTEVDKLVKSQSEFNGQVEDMKREIAALRQQVLNLEAERSTYLKKIDEYEARISALEKGKPLAGGGGAPAADKDALYKRAQASMDAGQINDARRDYRDFLKQFPTDPRADDAQLALGDLFMKEKTYDKAMGEFQKVVDGWPTGDLVDDALFRSGEAAAALKWCTDARAYFGLLVKDHPKSPLAKDAQKKLDYLKKNAKKKDICQS
jgi:TolA-binding protein